MSPKKKMSLRAKRNQIMVRITCENETYAQFREVIKPLSISDALGVMVKSAVESNTRPFASVIEDLLRVTLSGEKLGTLLDNIETSRDSKSTPGFPGDETSKKEAKKKR